MNYKFVIGAAIMHLALITGMKDAHAQYFRPYVPHYYAPRVFIPRIYSPPPSYFLQQQQYNWQAQQNAFALQRFQRHLEFRQYMCSTYGQC